jgi:hypothetical protein
MVILGQDYRRRRRPKGPLILAGIAALLIGFLGFAYTRGGEVPTSRVEKTIPLPAAAQGDARAASGPSEG